MDSVMISTRLEDFKNNLWRYHFVIPKSEVSSIIADNHKRIRYRIKGQNIWVSAALMAKGDECFFINVNQDRRKQFQLEEGTMVDLEIIQDQSKYGIDIAEEFEAFLDVDDVFKRYFDQLTPGKQRSLIHLASKPKRSETRIHKSLKIVDYLKLNEGKLDFKALHESFKEKN